MEKLSLDFRPEKLCGIYEVSNDKFGYLYNPKGYGGIVVLDKESFDMLSTFDGTKKILEISYYYNKDSEEIRSAVQQLIDLDILKGEKSFKSSYEPKIDCWLHTTNACNFACTYCYIHKYPANMSLDTAKETVDKLIAQAHKVGAKSIIVRFAGGEPLLRKKFLKRVIDYTNCVKGNLNAQYTILSNGTLIDDETISFIKKNNITLGISLDGIGKFNSNRIYANGKSSFEDVFSAINLLIENKIYPRVLITVCPNNLQGLKELTSVLIKKGLDIRFSLERNMDTGHPEIIDHIDETISTIKDCIDLMIGEIKQGNTSFAFQLGDVTFTHPKTRSCGIGKNSIAVSHTGDVGTCGMDLTNTFANIKTDDVFSKMHDEYKDLLNTHSTKINGCKDCTWKYSCANACPKQNMATCGKYDSLSPYCKIYKDLIPKVLGMQALKIWHQNN